MSKSLVNKLRKLKYNYSLKHRLKNGEFSIISSNCLAGILYHRLAMKFLSPTINLWIDSHDFIMFCEHIHDYVNAEISFVKSEKTYPVGLIKPSVENLPSIKVYFLHYKDESQALAKWNERKKRINYERMYIIADDKGLTEDEIERFDKISCLNKVLFTANKNCSSKYSYFISKYELRGSLGKYLTEVDSIGVSFLEYEFDFVGFLNSER